MASAKRSLYPRPNAELARRCLEWLQASAVIVLAWEPDGKGGAKLTAGCLGKNALVTGLVTDVGMEIVEDLDREFIDTGDLRQAVGLSE